MKKESILDFIIILNTFILFLLPLYFNATNQPLEIQILPIVLLAVPVAVSLYKKRSERQRIEKQRIVDKAKKLDPLLHKLFRISHIYNVASGLTYNKKFLDDELASKGWRRYFERYGDHMINELNYYDFDSVWFISQTSRHTEEELHDKLLGFCSLVRGFRHLYDDLTEMIQLAGKNPPKEEIKNIQEIEENYDDFFEALRNLCDEDEEIRKIFEGKYLLKKPHKLSNIH